MAERARHQPDEKLKKLFEYIDQNMLEPTGQGSGGGRRWTDHRILIFTEYDDTLAYIRRHLEAHHPVDVASRATDSPIYKGSTSLEERQEIKEAFNADPAAHPVRILLATDAAREGLNLQKYCFNLFHYDIPWNPARLEQRNGRIDRKLQPAPTVYCRYFLYENREEDTILRRIVEKTETIYRELGGFGTVLDKNLIQSLRRRGIERSRVARNLPACSTSRTRRKNSAPPWRWPRSPATRRRARRTRAASKQRARLATGSIEGAARSSSKSVESSVRSWRRASLARLPRSPVPRRPRLLALRLMEIEGGLRPEPVERPRHAGTSSPRPRSKEPLLARDAQQPAGPAPPGRRPGLLVRPVSGPADRLRRSGSLPAWPADRRANRRVRVEPVHMHLEHRISQRLLSRFQSQGFVYHDLSRACLPRRKARCRWSTCSVGFAFTAISDAAA